MADEAARQAARMNELRVQLYVRVGAVTVAGGRVEYAMQRLAHVIGGGKKYDPNITVPVE